MQKRAASTLGLRRVLALGQYSPARTWLHELRRAMVRPGLDRVAGWVAVHEVCVGGQKKAAPSLKLARKALAGRGLVARRVDRQAGAPPPALRADLLVLAEPSGALARPDQPARDQACLVPQRYGPREQDQRLHTRPRRQSEAVHLGRHSTVHHRQGGAFINMYFRYITLAGTLDLSLSRRPRLQTAETCCAILHREQPLPLRW